MSFVSYTPHRRRGAIRRIGIFVVDYCNVATNEFADEPPYCQVQYDIVIATVSSIAGNASDDVATTGCTTAHKHSGYDFDCDAFAYASSLQ